MSRNIFIFLFIEIFLLGNSSLTYAKLPSYTPKFIMSTDQPVSSVNEALELIKINQTAILTELGSDIKTLWIEHVKDPEEVKWSPQLKMIEISQRSQRGFNEIEFLFHQERFIDQRGMGGGREGRGTVLWER